MTDRHDDAWDLADDEEIRAALMSLMDDVTAEPLPEPAFVRARAEGLTDGGRVVDLDRRRRRSFTVLAGVAAAAVLAMGAGMLVWDRDDSVPPATSSSSSDDLRPMTMLGSPAWSTVLGMPVSSTDVTTEPTGQCFTIPDTDTWTRQVSRLEDGRVVAGQWIGTAEVGGAAPTGAVDDAVERCADTHPTSQHVTEDLPGNATYRSWHATSPDGTGVWWVEATRGPSVSFLSVAEVDGMSYTSDDMRQVALGALGDVDLTEGGAIGSSASSTSTSAPTSTATSAPTPSSPAPTGGPASTDPSTGAPTVATSPPSSAPTSPTTIGPVTGDYFVPPASWASQTLTGGRQVGTSATDPDQAMDACTGEVRSDHSRGWRLSIVGDDGRPFGEQHVFLELNAADADARLREITRGYERSTCTAGPGDSVAVTKMGSDVYRLEGGAGVRYVSVVRLRSHAVAVLALDSSALPDLDDAQSADALRRLARLAAQR